jgi:opacity protein-like surface antigen
MKQNLHSSVWKCWIITLVILSHCLPSYSQYGDESSSFWEAGITAGPSNFLGDLGGTAGIGRKGLKDNNFPLTKFNFGIWLTYQPSEWLAFRLNLSMGRLEGDDAIIKGKGGYEEARKLRNQDFRSPIQEAFIGAEIYPSVFFEYEPSDIYHKLRPYGLIGIGIAKLKPQGTDPLTGQWVDLTPLSLEGEGFPEFPDRKKMNLMQINVPLGIGVKYFVNDNMHVGVEIVHRTFFTDGIDATSTTYIDPALYYAHLPLAQAQLAERMGNKSNGTGTYVFGPGQKRGTPENNDAYYTFQVKWGVRLFQGDRWGNSTRCPVRF